MTHGNLQLEIQIQTLWDANFHGTSHGDLMCWKLRIRMQKTLFTCQLLYPGIGCTIIIIIIIIISFIVEEANCCDTTLVHYTLRCTVLQGDTKLLYKYTNVYNSLHYIVDLYNQIWDSWCVLQQHINKHQLEKTGTQITYVEFVQKSTLLKCEANNWGAQVHN